jgi:hypothetical protein
MFLYDMCQEVRVRNEVNTPVGPAKSSHSVAYALDCSGDAVEADFVSLGSAL